MAQKSEIFAQNPEPDEYIVHWAQWWGITLVRVINAPSGSNERRMAYNLHQDAKSSLCHSLGIDEKDAHHG